MPHVSRSRLTTATLLALAISAFALMAVGIAGAQEVDRFTREHASTQEGWVDTGISLADGETATATVSFGRASWDGGQGFSGPEGTLLEHCEPLVPEHPIGALLMRAGSRPATKAIEGTVKGPGKLQLAYNDCPGHYFDNAGTYSVSLSVTRVPIVAPTPVPQPAAPADEHTARTGASFVGIFLKLLMALAALVVLAGLGLGVALLIAGRRPRFNPTARLESSAWLAPIRLCDLQGERMPKASLTIGGPDADIDFGLAGVRARVLPTADGATRLEQVGTGERVFINGMPLVIGQRLGSGQRVKIGVRDFVYREERTPRGRAASGAAGDLNRPDPRAA